MATSSEIVALVLQDDSHVEDFAEEEEILPYHFSLTSYGADFDVAGLVRRLESGDIRIPTFDPETETSSGIEGFQRDFVWSATQVHRFIESLLLRLPVPGIFLVRDSDDVLLVLDGQQRLRSLQAFYSGLLHGKEFRLRNVHEPFAGKTYDELDDDDRRALDNTIIHATIVRQDDPRDPTGIYMIFERLNTGGTQLTAHQIRVALFRGDILELLRELNNDDHWRTLYGRKSSVLKDQELVLRFFALLERGDKYKQPMTTFLNDYMAAHRALTDDQRSAKEVVFRATVEAIDMAIGDRAFRPERALNAAVLDSVMIGVARRLDRGPIADPTALSAAYEQLLSDSEYTELVSRTTANEERVRARIAKATAAFAAVR